MKFSFNLAEKPWIPVIRLNGTADELSLRDLLVQAHELREIFDPSPAVTLSLYRLAIALLHRIFRADTEDEWVALWKSRQFPPEPVDGYLKGWRHRFDLFDEEKPFWQVGKFTLRKKSPVSELSIESVSGNNPVLFDHSTDEIAIAWRPAEAARKLIALQMVSPSFGISGVPEIAGQKVVQGSLHRHDTPLVRGAAVLMNGRYLKQMLILNLLTNGFRGQILTTLGKPLWELDSSPLPGTVLNTSEYLRYLTMLPRWIRLLPEGEQPMVKCIYLAQGEIIPDGLKDQFKRYHFNEKDAKKPWKPVAFRPEKALWRDSAAWLETTQGTSNRNHPPEVIRQIQYLIRHADLDLQDSLNLSIIGILVDDNNQAKIRLWRNERLVAPLAYLTHDGLTAQLTVCLNWAEEAAKGLSATTKAMSHQILAFQSDRKADPKKVKALVSHLAPSRRYWPRLEEPFHRLLNGIPVDADPAMREWMSEIVSAMRTSFEETVRMLPQRARELEAIVKARDILKGKIRKMKKDIPLFNEEKTDDV